MKNLFTKVIGVCCSLIIISVLTATNVQAQYCAASSGNTSDDWLSHVSFAGIENSSGSTTYSDYTSISGLVVPGVSYDFVGTIGLAGSWTQTITVYIDWDQSGSWDSSERYTIGTYCSNNGCQLSELIEVPMTALPGETRMRVIEAYSSNNTNPCSGPTYGEVEDYTITVLSGECTPPNFDFEVINDCENENYDVAATLTDFGGSSFVTINFTRSDGVTQNPVTLIFALQGQTVNILNNIPFGVTVSASIQGQNPLCNLTRNFAELYCHIDGEVCEAPLVVSELPYTHSGNTSLYLNDYNSTNVPAYAENAIIAGVTGTYYLNGDDVVYAYTPEEDGAIDISAVTGTYGGLWVFTGCPFEVTVGSHLDWDPPASTRKVDHLPVLAGVTYYIVISTWAAPQDTEYTLTITPWEDCEGTPTAGTLGDDMMVCAATGFQLISSDASPDANGLIFTWQSSPVGANTWTDVAGANTPNYNLAAGITEDSDFRLKAYCTATDATTYSDVMTVSINPVYTECYCIATYTYDCNSGDDLSNVSLTGESVALNNTTNCNGGYNDYTDMPAVDLAPGETYTLSASTTYGSPTYEQVKAWIDYNLNGAFEPEELIANTATNGLPGGTDSFVFTVPEGQDPGEYRLRVRLVYGLDMDFDACSDDSFGETEDYMVEIIDLDACAGTPEAGTADNDEMLVCATIPFNISVAGASDPANGLSRIWQSSPAGANTWTDIAGATSANYTLAGGIDIPTDFRYIVECENSGQSDVSNIVEVTLKPATECYCTPSSVYGVDYFISHVTTNNALQDLDKTSGFTTGGYADYSDTDILIAHANQEFDFSIDLGTYTTRVGIWIDLNQNGSFLDEGENIVLTPNYVSNVSGTILVPGEMPDGNYRMRIRTVSGTPAPCGLQDYSEAEDYTLQIITLNECAGTPDAGTVAADFSVCAANAFYLNVSGASSPAEGLIRNWQSSPVGANTWSDILDATAVNYTVAAGIDTPTDFRYRVTCENSGETAYSNVVSVGLNPGIECYCIPTYTYDCTSGDDLSNVTLTGESVVLNNSTVCNGGYNDYTDLPAPDLAPGETYTLSASTTYSSPTLEQVKAWIDYNENGAFEEGEEIANSATNGLPGGTDSFDFTVLEGIAPGEYRLRVRLVYGSDMDFDACSSDSYGETEDYTVEIIELNTCTGTPDAGTADANEYVVCANNPLSMSVEGASDPADGLTRSWQLSTDGGSSWSNIAGATSTIYTHPGISIDTDFRYSVTCTNSGETDYSNVLEMVINTVVTDCYCIPSGTSSTYYVSGFSTTNGVENITNTGSGLSIGGYGDFTDMTVSQVQTQSVNFSGTFSSGTAGFRIWVDWNQDGYFDAANEVVYNSSSYSTSWSGSFVVPATALSGPTRMRIEGDWSSSQGFIDPCGTTAYGEFEDYTFNVIALEDCAGTPEAGTADNDELEICENQGFTLSVTGASDPSAGLDRFWQTSTDGGVTWTNIPGATSTTYVNSGISVSASFRYSVMCTNTGEYDYSNVVTTSFKPAFECYCVPTTANNTYHLISFTATGNGVQDINNTGTGSSLNGTGYSDYTSLPALTAVAGGTVDFTAEVNSASNAGFRIWIDWGQNGTFADQATGEPNEVVYSSSSYLYTHTGTFSIPADVSGTFRVRIASSYIPNTGPDSPCDLPTWGGEYEDYMLTVSGEDAVLLSGTVNWNSNCGDRAGIVSLYTPNTATLIATHDITVDANGGFSIADLPTGTFDIIVKIDGHLAKGIEDVEITAGANTLAVGTIRNGNVNNDNSINVFDLSVINMSFNKAEGQANFNPLADLNCDGSVNIFDISILNASFNKSGAVAPL